MRIFIGIDLDSSLKNKIFQLQEMIKPYVIKGNWKYEDNFHLTLRFLGEVEESQLSVIDEAIQSMANKVNPFELQLKGGGSFGLKPSTDESKGPLVNVLWLGVDGNMKALSELYFELEYALSVKGFTKDYRDYAPHITLGQDLRFSTDISVVKPYFKALEGSFSARAITVFLSESEGGRRVYRPIRSYELGKTM